MSLDKVAWPGEVLNSINITWTLPRGNREAGLVEMSVGAYPEGLRRAFEENMRGELPAGSCRLNTQN